jgi:hypothetical protein
MDAPWGCRIRGHEVREVGVAVLGQHRQDVLGPVGSGDQMVALCRYIGSKAVRDRLPVRIRSEPERQAVHVGRLVVGRGGDGAVRPTWGQWFLQCGATTMWEAWEDTSCSTARSRDHAFMGTVDDWLFSGLAGIQATSPGFRTVQIAPSPVGNLTFVSGSENSPLGPVSSRAGPSLRSVLCGETHAARRGIRSRSR